MGASYSEKTAKAIDSLSVSDVMVSDVLSFVYYSGRLAFSAEGPDQAWAVDLIRVVLNSASKELRGKA